MEKIMDETEKIIIYDAYSLIMENSELIASLIEEHGTDEHKKAYKNGIYRPAIKLQILLGNEGLKKGGERHKKTRDSLENFFKNKELKKEE